MDTGVLKELVGASTLQLIEDGFSEEDITWDQITKFMKKMGRKNIVQDCLKQKMDKYNTFLSILNTAAKTKQLSGINKIVDAAAQVSGLEKICSEIKFNNLLIEQASYQLCDTSNFTKVANLLIRKHNACLTLIHPLSSEDDIALKKVEVKDELKNLLHSVSKTKDIVVEAAKILAANGLASEAEDLNLLVSQNEAAKKEFYEYKVFIRNLKDSKILLPITQILREDQPFSVTQMSKIYKGTSQLFPKKVLAIKEIFLGLSNARSVLKEVEINMKLKHEHILPI